MRYRIILKETAYYPFVIERSKGFPHPWREVKDFPSVAEAKLFIEKIMQLRKEFNQLEQTLFDIK